VERGREALSVGARARGPAIDRVTCHVLRFPTEDGPESDGTLEWSATTMVLVECGAGGLTGIGYSYTDAGAKRVIDETLAPCLTGCSAFDTPRAARRMLRSVRNLGRGGIAACAIAAVDVAIWDLKARLLGLSLSELLGRARDELRVYASGGFTSSGPEQLARELGGYRAQGFRSAKIKVGRDPRADPSRLRAAREAVGPDVTLMVDANGAYAPSEARRWAQRFAEADVEWFEEPVSSDDLPGLRQLRQHAPAGMAIAAGEYGFDPAYAQRMLEAEAVDVLQIDATRCLGVSGFLAASAIADARGRAVSSHCAPSIHRSLGLAVPRFEHLEYFRDHARLEALLFEGAAQPVQGSLGAESGSAGLGLTPRRQELVRHAL
jgi:L-alanine-DL-glutamate epimerase-like enolase superfamily enzyme